jgi:hypothetical protein
MRYIISLFLFLSFNCFASNEIIAVIGDDIITSHTLDYRYKIMLKERNYDPETISPQDKKQLKVQILQSLINERILRQEADKLQIKVTNEEMETAIKHIEKTQKIAPGSFRKEIKAQGLPIDVVLDQIKNTILWEKMMGELFVPKIEISIKEIYEFMDKFHPERVLVNFYFLETNKNNTKTLSDIHTNITNCEQINNTEISQYSKKKITTNRVNTTLKNVEAPEIQEVIISPNTRKSMIFESGNDSVAFALLCSKEYKVTPENLSHLRNLLKEKKAHLQLDQYIKKARQNKFIDIYNIE